MDRVRLARTRHPFPPAPVLKGRRAELSTLSRIVVDRHPAQLALVGGGGSGKSTLAAALGHRVARHFAGGIHWFRVGAWDTHTLGEMLALRFGVKRDRLWPNVRRALASRGPTLIVLDNHEDDAAIADLLRRLGAVDVTFVITARRCLLGGVSIFPVVPPLVGSGRAPFPAVKSLTRLLRWNPLALDVANALVESGVVTPDALGAYLVQRGVARVRVIAHEDDLPEVRLLVDFTWRRLAPAARRLLAVLAHTDGDHMDRASLVTLARVGHKGARALATLRRWHLVQEPFAGRFALHATVRYALEGRTRFDRQRHFEHYMSMLERHPERLDSRADAPVRRHGPRARALATGRRAPRQRVARTPGAMSRRRRGRGMPVRRGIPLCGLAIVAAACGAPAARPAAPRSVPEAAPMAAPAPAPAASAAAELPAAGPACAPLHVEVPAPPPLPAPAPLPAIEDPHDTLAPFFEKLARRARGEPVTIRIALYGDSNMTQDLVSGELRRVLQARYGDAGHGFVAFGKPWPWYTHRDVRHGIEPRGWVSYAITTHPVLDQRYGFAGIAAQCTSRGARAWVETAPDGAPVGTRVSRFDVYYLAWPHGGELEIRVDGDRRALIDTHADAPHALFRAVDVADGPHRLGVVATRGVRVFGTTLERSAPGVIVDSLGVGGVNVEVLAREDMDVAREALAHRQLRPGDADHGRHRGRSPGARRRAPPARGAAPRGASRCADAAVEPAGLRLRAGHAPEPEPAHRAPRPAYACGGAVQRRGVLGLPGRHGRSGLDHHVRRAPPGRAGHGALQREGRHAHGRPHRDGAAVRVQALGVGAPARRLSVTRAACFRARARNPGNPLIWVFTGRAEERKVYRDFGYSGTSRRKPFRPHCGLDRRQGIRPDFHRKGGRTEGPEGLRVSAHEPSCAGTEPHPCAPLSLNGSGRCRST